MLVFPAADVIYAVNVVYCIKLFAQEPAEAIPICSLCLRADTVSQPRGTHDDAMLCCIDCGRCGQSFQHLPFYCCVMSRFAYMYNNSLFVFAVSNSQVSVGISVGDIDKKVCLHSLFEWTAN